MRKQIAAANWKMNLTLAEGEKLISDILACNSELKAGTEAIFAVPFPYLVQINSLLKGGPGLFVSAQNIAAMNNGAFTGEVSGAMLKSIGVQYAIIGHSERREYYHEHNAVLVEKVLRSLEHDIHPIFCCGEPLSIRENGSQNTYVFEQLKEGLFHLDAAQMKNFIIAYEPIWAIGTGKTATSDQAEDMHLHIRSLIEKKYGADIADSVSILYGGSVKGANAKEIFGKPNVDGGLVGGASLNATEFCEIMKSLKS